MSKVARPAIFPVVSKSDPRWAAGQATDKIYLAGAAANIRATQRFSSAKLGETLKPTVGSTTLKAIKDVAVKAFGAGTSTTINGAADEVIDTVKLLVAAAGRDRYLSADEFNDACLYKNPVAEALVFAALMRNVSDD